MNLRLLLLPSVCLAALSVVACGDDPNRTIENATTPRVTQTAASSSPFGPAPKLGGNILEVSPKHAESIVQGATRSPNPSRPQGVCAQVSFQDLPESGQWFRMAIDGVEVTDQLVWIVASTSNPTGGTVCFAPTEGLTVGSHAAAISVQNPNNPAAATKQLVAWKFAVTE